MIASAIREFGLSRDGRWMAAGHFEKQIELWDLSQQRKVTQLLAIFTSGASTLVVPPHGQSVIAGSSRRGELAAYRIPDGTILWHRKLLNTPSKLRYSDIGETLFCSMRRRTDVERIDPSTGETIEVIRGVEQYWEDRYGRVFFVPHRGSLYLLRDSRRELKVEVDRLTFALLDRAFAPDCFCLSESGGPVRCIDALTGGLRWRFDPDKGSHVLSLYYSERAGFYYGVLRQYEDGLYRRLLRFSKETGEWEVICELDSWEDAFIPGHDQLVTSAGLLIDLTTGKTVAQLEFPQKEYPDPVEG
jgi:outer membrane protein assembly factor BamB